MNHYSMLIQWSEADQAYIVTLPEFGDCHTHGETYEDAVKNGEEVLQLLIETYQQRGDALPRPVVYQPA